MLSLSTKSFSICQFLCTHSKLGGDILHMIRTFLTHSSPSTKPDTTDQSTESRQSLQSNWSFWRPHLFTGSINYEEGAILYLIVLLLSVKPFSLNASHIQHISLWHGFFQTAESLLQQTRILYTCYIQLFNQSTTAFVLQWKSLVWVDYNSKCHDILQQQWVLARDWSRRQIADMKSLKLDYWTGTDWHQWH